MKLIQLLALLSFFKVILSQGEEGDEQEVELSYYTPVESELDVTAKTNNAEGTNVRDIGQCYCDFTSKVCEFNCCCDVDCTETEIQFWQSNNQCLAKSLNQKCVKDYLLYYINKKRGMKILSNPSQKEICIQSDSQTVFDTFYEEKTKIPDETIKRYYQNISVALGVKQPQKGDIIKTQLTPYKGYGLQKSDNDGDFSNFNIWYPDSFGVCNKVKSVKFLNNIDKVQCSILYRLQNDCAVGGKLDLERYIDLNVRVKASNTSSQTINIGTTKYYRMNDGESKYSSSGQQTISLDQFNNICTCNNVIDGIRFLIIYNEQSYTITDIEVHIYQGAQINGECQKYLQKSYFTEVNYINSEGTFFDGNVGYKHGQKVYGSKNNVFSNLGIVINKGYDTQGLCSSKTDTPNDLGEFDPNNLDYLRFGQSISISCLSVLTTLQESCNQEYLFGLSIFDNFPYEADYVKLARTAYANREYPREWISLSLVEMKEKIEYFEDDQICRLPTQYNLLIFYSKMGHHKNRQQYIQQAYLAFSNFRNITSTDQINFSLNVEWTNLLEGDIENAKPETPSFIPQLPDDFFFPVWYEINGKLLTILITLLLIIE